MLHDRFYITHPVLWGQISLDPSFFWDEDPEEQKFAHAFAQIFSFEYDDKLGIKNITYLENAYVGQSPSDMSVQYSATSLKFGINYMVFVFALDAKKVPHYLKPSATNMFKFERHNSLALINFSI